MMTTARILEEYRAAFRRLAGSGVIDIDRHLRHHFNFQIHRLEDLIRSLDGEIPLNRQSQFFINLIIKGSGTKTIGAAHFPISKNSLFVIPRRMVHASSYWSAACTGYYLGFNMDFFLSGDFSVHLLANKRIFRHAGRHHLILTPAQTRQLTALYETLLDEYQYDRPHKNETLVLKVLELVITCDRFFSDGEPPVDETRMEIIDRFEELIRDHHQMDRSVAYYARLLHTHPNHLNALVKKYTGVTAKATIMGYILTEARHLLCSTSMSIKEIASRLGFEDPERLSVLFRRNFGVSPRSLRKGPAAAAGC